MNILTVVNEILRKADEPLVTNTQQHDGVKKLVGYLKDVGRELSYTYALDASKTILRYTFATVPSPLTTLGVQRMFSPNVVANGFTVPTDGSFIVDRITYSNGKPLGKRFITESVMQGISEFPTKTALVDEPVGWSFVGFTPTTTGSTQQTSIITYPQLPQATTLNVYCRFNPIAALNLPTDDLVDVRLPPSLLILGGFAKWHADKMGTDHPDTAFHSSVYTSAVGHYIAVSSEVEDAPKDWIPE